MLKKTLVLLASILISSCSFAQGSPSAKSKTVAESLGYPANSRLLIIHADDFGMMRTVDRAIMEALEQHWVTSASILVPCPWFPEVAVWAKAHPDADLGVHLALNSEWTTYRWGPVSPQPRGSSLLFEDGYLPPTTEYVDAHAKVEDVKAETRAQIDKAQAAGIHLSHLDTHMETLLSTAALLDVYLTLGRDYKLPVLLGRDQDLRGLQVAPSVALVDRVVQISPGVPKSQWMDTYKKMLAPLPPGTYELIVHLAYDNDEIRGATSDVPDWGAAWRQNDFDMVRSQDFRQFLRDQGFILISWKDLAKVSLGEK
jgi:chitin disaccharide deacetylase